MIFTGCSSPLANRNSQGQNIICFGDSVTDGYGISRSETFPAILEESLGVPVINAGHSGDTTRDALQRLERDVLSKDPRLVIVEFGANDYFQHLPQEETFKNMRRIIKSIQAKGAMVAIAAIRVGLLGDPYEKKMKKLAKETRSLYIPNIMAGILANPELKVDQIHPNAKGHRIIAKKIEKFIRPLLSK